MLSYSKGQAVVVLLKCMLLNLAAVIVVGVATAVAALIQGGGAVAGASHNTFTSNPWRMIAADSLALAGLLAWEIKSRQLSWAKALAMRMSPFLPFAPAVLIGLGGFVIVSEIGNCVVTVLPVPGFFLKLVESLGDRSAHPVGAALLLVVAAPAAEEIVFRGFILRGLLNHGVAARTAVLWSALLFGVMHLNPWQGVTAFFLGLIFGWVYLRTRSLALCMMLHAIQNGCVLIAIRWPAFGECLGGSDPDVVVFNPWWLNAAGAVLLAGGIIWMRFLTRGGAATR